MEEPGVEKECGLTVSDCDKCAAPKINRRRKRSKRPLTGKEVDRALSSIVAAPGGKALYFESADTAQKYIASMQTKEKD